MVKRYKLVNGLIHYIRNIGEHELFSGEKEIVFASDYDKLAEQYASYREAASASIGADLNQQVLDRIAQLEAALRRIRDAEQECNEPCYHWIDALLDSSSVETK